MESFIAELEAERVAELEAERVAELSAYLKVSGYDNYELSDEELDALQKFEMLEWSSFNLKDLFGQSTRGKRLKGADRISGTLPFVTAGEADEGISAYISNDVEVFEKNTTPLICSAQQSIGITNTVQMTILQLFTQKSCLSMLLYL